MKPIVIIPTYNEKATLQKLVTTILALKPQFYVVVVDDNSPDGTGQIAERLAKKYPTVRVIHRQEKKGLGTAYLEGFKYALAQGADYILQMDGDFSHHPKYLPKLLEKARDYDLVIGSRYRDGVRVNGWPFGRLLLSKFATLYTNLITGIPAQSITDATSGFKCFRREVLESLDLKKIRSNGYSFNIEMTYRIYQKGFRIWEIPIMFTDRNAGSSKMTKKIIWEAVWLVWKLRLGL